MPACGRCGADNKPEAKFCAFCAAPMVAPPAPPPAPMPPPPPPWSQDECFGTREREPSFPGALSFAFFLIIVGVVFLANPNIFTNFQAWGENMVNVKYIPRPPEALIWSGVLFFAAAGVSDFVTAALRYSMKGRRRKVLGDVFTGIALIVFAWLTSLRSSDISRI